MSTDTERLHPIIYVRGYAGSQSEVEDTAADPFMGFNLGSTKVRQLWTGEVVKHYFESPFVRLITDFGYRDVFDDGDDLPASIDPATPMVVIYRYYEPTSTQLGTGQRLTMEQAGAGLGELILRVRDVVAGTDPAALAKFRVYLVAHSMGGLVCRTFLQNPAVGTKARMDVARGAVDKVFTYATPHNGIDLAIVGNVPSWASMNDSNNFNRSRMKAYLALPPSTPDDDVSSLNGAFDPDRFFTLVGTNHKDYAVAGGLSRALAGEMSDGLVRIANATVHGPWAASAAAPGAGAGGAGAGGAATGGAASAAAAIVEKSSPRSFVHRSHSGHYGIVNSEEGYQNLIRFFFGDVRVDGVLEVKALTLPSKVEEKRIGKLIRVDPNGVEVREPGKQIRASYHFETIVRVRGARWDLHRRVVEESSAVFRKFDEMFPPGGGPPKNPHLFSVFLRKASRVNPLRRSLGFSVDLRVLVPEYEIDGFLFFNDHFEGGYLFRDKINFEATPDDQAPGGWKLKYGLDSSTPNRATRDVTGVQVGTPSTGASTAGSGGGASTGASSSPGDSHVEFRIPVQQNTTPGIDAELVLRARPWA